MKPYNVVFPDYLDGCEWEAEAKGYAVGVEIREACDVYDIVVYDDVRLMQEIRDQVARDGYFAAANLLVVPRVTRENIARAAEKLSLSGFAELSARSIDTDKSS